MLVTWRASQQQHPFSLQLAPPSFARPIAPAHLHLLTLPQPHNHITGMARRVLLLLLAAGTMTPAASTTRSSGFVCPCPERRRGSCLPLSSSLLPSLQVKWTTLESAHSSTACLSPLIPLSPPCCIVAFPSSSRPEPRMLPSPALTTATTTTTRLYHSLRVHNLDSLTVEQLKDVSRVDMGGKKARRRITKEGWVETKTAHFFVKAGC